MQIIAYPHIQETLYSETLANGLRVYLLPKKGFSKTFATFSTPFGSKDVQYRLAHQETANPIPLGTAHFLEHKLFAKPDYDVFARFAERGGSVNAYTGFDRTTYLFSATEHLEEHLNHLLDFVQTPYFTAPNIEKERGIIAQEILMYRDNPDWRLYFGLLQGLFQTLPIRYETAGTVDSIQAIDEQVLYDCYDAFYRPEQMCLFVVGGFEAASMMDTIRQNQAKKNVSAKPFVHRLQIEEPPDICERNVTCTLPVSLPKCLFGFKQVYPHKEGRALLALESAAEILFQYLFAASSPLYQTLYSEQLLVSGLSFQIQCNNTYAFSVMGGATPNPDRLVERFSQLLQATLQQGITEASFLRIKRKVFGNRIRLFNSMQAVSGRYTADLFRGADLFESIPALQAVTLAQVKDVAEQHFNWERLAVSVVRKDSP